MERMKYLLENWASKHSLITTFMIWLKIGKQILNINRKTTYKAEKNRLANKILLIKNKFINVSSVFYKLEICIRAS